MVAYTTSHSSNKNAMKTRGEKEKKVKQHRFLGEASMNEEPLLLTCYDHLAAVGSMTNDMLIMHVFPLHGMFVCSMQGRML